MKIALIVFSVVLFGFGSANGQTPTTVFKGLPSIKVSEGEIDRTPEEITREKAVNLQCIISKIGDDYYWATRENTQMVAVDSGAFITFIALGGSGYIRIIKPDLKEAASLMSPTEDRFDYVEHLLIGLRSVTYYGKRD